MAARDPDDLTDAGRLRRLEALDELLPALASVLDVREVFVRVSEITQGVLPHALLGLPLIDDDGLHVVLHAVTGSVTPEMPPRIPIPDPAMVTSPWDHMVIPDLLADPREKDIIPAKMGMRSCVRIALRLKDRLIGALDFYSPIPGFYHEADVVVLRRIADYVLLALSHERIAREARQIEELRQKEANLEARVQTLTDELDARSGYRRVVGESRAWREVLKQATQVAATDATVLLLGESGTGKEVVARFLHRASSRKTGPFVALNCAALPEHLLEAELFGYERGAFTGATQTKPGQLEQASGGTLLLDEVGEMSLAAQAKFLRVLQEREFQRLGGTRALRTDARIVAATNRNLQGAMDKGTFREDLFFRLNVFAINLPPLRERREDILPLSEAFLVEIGRGIGRPPAGISRDARQLLVDYGWPGNVRELRNILERAAILCDGGLITSDHLALRPVAIPAPASPVTHKTTAPAPAAPPETSALDLGSMERTMIEQALQNARFNKSKAAKELGLTRTQLYVRMRKYGLS